MLLCAAEDAVLSVMSSPASVEDNVGVVMDDASDNANIDIISNVLTLPPGVENVGKPSEVVTVEYDGWGVFVAPDTGVVTVTDAGFDPGAGPAVAVGPAVSGVPGDAASTV